MKTYKIINIINNYSVLINYGISDGAKVGKQVRVFMEGTPIYDGDECLGNLDIIKEDLEITVVYENFSICKHVEKVTKNPFMAFSLERTYHEVKKLNVSENDFSNIQYKSNEPLKIGDTVKIL